MIRRLLLGLGLLAACTPAPPLPRAAPAPQAPSLSRELSAAQRAWVERTLASLSLREKVGQLMMPWVSADYTAVHSADFERLRRWVVEDKVGGVVMSVGMPHSYAAKLNALQQLAELPLLVTSDMENGPGMRMAGIYSFPHLLAQGGGTAFPPVMALGATRSDSLAYALGQVLGREARAVGVQMTFGPVLDVNSNPLNPIINTRSFGEDPELVGRLATAYIRGARDAGLMTTGKHFPGHGDTDVDSHLDLPRISASRQRLDAVELRPFRTAIDAGVDAIMTAHVAVVGIEGPDAPPATMSPFFGTRLLREELGFRGLLFTDALDMGGVTRRYGRAEAAVRALQAGADVLLMPPDLRGAIEAVLAALQEGRVEEARIDASVRRILEAKARAGLHESRLVSLEAIPQVVATREHSEIARTVAERALVLARDQQHAVPLAAGARRVLSVTYADAADPIAGRAFERELQAADTARSVVSARVDERSTPEEYAALQARVDSADVVLVGVYVTPREFRGTVGAAGGFTAWLRHLAASGKPVVVTSFGNPYLLSGFPAVPAYLLAWGGQEVAQQAAARALLGRAPITGTLPISLPPHHRFGEGLQRAAAGGGR